MIALGGPKLKLKGEVHANRPPAVSMIALGGPKLKPINRHPLPYRGKVSMIALGGPKLKRIVSLYMREPAYRFNDSTGWA